MAAIPSCASRSVFPQRPRLRSAHGADRAALARIARRARQAFSAEVDLSRHAPDLNGYWKFFGRIDVGEGFFFHAPVPKDTTRDNFDFMGLLHEATGFPFKAEFDHVGFWDLRVAVARNTRPVACSSPATPRIASALRRLRPQQRLEDAVNLGWKLAAKLDGWGGDTLLQSYSDERRPIFKEVAEDFIAARIRNDGAFLNRYNPARDKAEFETAWKGQESDVGNRAQVYEPSYEARRW
jgi:hypothetical protein